MKTIELTTMPSMSEELLRLADEENLLIRRPDGKVFFITEVDQAHDEVDDFEDEIVRIRRNKALMAFLSERSQEPGRYSLEQVREQLEL